VTSILATNEASSDGAIVVPVLAPQPVTIRQLIRRHLPDALIAFVVGGIAGSMIDACIHR